MGYSEQLGVQEFPIFGGTIKHSRKTLTGERAFLEPATILRGGCAGGTCLRP